MKKQLLKIVSLSAVTFLTCLGAAGCNGNSDDGKTVVKFFGWGKAPEQRNFQIMVNAFMEDNPDVKVVYECVDPSNYDTALQNRIKSLPDVFYMADYSFNKWVNTGRLLDISSYVSEEERSKIWPVAINMYQYDLETQTLGKGPGLYGLSKDLGPYSIVYNKTMIKKIFEEKGMTPRYPDPSTPMTWGEFSQYLEDLKYINESGERIWGIGSYEIMHAVYSNNADFWTEDVRTSRIGEKNFADAIQFISNLTRDGLAPSYVDMKASNAYSKFINQTCLMTFMGPWDLAAFWQDTNFEFDVMPTPVGTAEGAVSTSWIGSVALSCRKFSEKEKTKEEAAVRLAKYLTIGDRCAKLNYQLGQAQPNNMEIAKNDWVNNKDLDIETIKSVANNADWAKNLTTEKIQQPASKQVWVDITSANNQIRYHNRARYYLYNESLFENLIKELNSGVIFEGKDNAAEFCANYNSTFQEALDDNAAYYR